MRPWTSSTWSSSSWPRSSLAQERGIGLGGPRGLLSQLTKRVLETALEELMSEHLGYDEHEYAGWDGGDLSAFDIQLMKVLKPETQYTSY